MIPRSRTFAFLCAALLFSGAAARAEKLRSHFDFDALNQPPGFFDFVVLGGPGPARWIVINDDTAPSPPQAAAQVIDSRPDGSIAAALRRNSTARDGSWSLSVKRGPSRAGLVFRVANDKNFLLLLVDCATGKARLLSYRNGQPLEVASGLGVFGTGWARLVVTGRGPAISATFDGKPLLQATDPSPASGTAGMATTGPGTAEFDELVIEAADEPARR